ncbi:hypothetical protein BDV95DRAFT_494952 [Massariosphaeria phaeospora]|uniref:Short chain dehydrogenase n=1 Tax=Massariosphaeria phaeospora TaxID=100035 RepID=A0A7C8ID93_9PLEO|nr:hypothetical protein BDV95DRAFT_494952 [Massariosphaeria phaeospora]
MAATAKQIVLITGANSGIGFELAAQLLAKGTYHVLLCARTPSKGQTALSTLQSRNLPGTAELLHLDVTSDASITAAFDLVSRTHGRLDMLVNNAAVALPPGTLREKLRVAFDTNATGPAVLTATFAPLLQRAGAAPGARIVIVNVSSGVGSIARRLDRTSPMYALQEVQYRASKTALSMVTACQFAEYEPRGWKVFAYDPGFTVSKLGPHNTAENGARVAGESVAPLVRLLEGARDAENGGFLHNTGSWPW